jgi:L-fuculose-phosphate aldolase
MLITPSRAEPSRLGRRHIVACTLAGRATRGTPSLEWSLHAEVYLARPDAMAIAHTHSPAAIARSFDRSALWTETEEAPYLGWGPIPVAPWRPPGSLELAAAALATLGSGSAVLLERHGVMANGRTPREALEHAAIVEHLARIDMMVKKQWTA